MLYGSYDIGIEDVPTPSLKTTDVLVRVKASSICPTDVRKYCGLSKVEGSLILGHEVSGEIVKKGELASNVKLGDRVALDSNIYCYTCYYCRKGRFNNCINAKGIGASREGMEKIDGSFAEFLVVPSVNAYSIGDTPFEEVCLAEPLSASIKAIHDCQVEEGDTVVVIGAGPLGLMQLSYSKLLGARVIVSELLEFRRKMAEKFEADVVADPRKQDLKEIVLKETERGADAVLVSVGGGAEAKCTEQALEFVGKGGYVNVFAGTWPETPVMISPNLLHYDEIKVTGTFSHTPTTYSKALELICSRKVDFRPLITHVYPLDKIKQAFEIVLHKRENALKVIIKP